MVEPEKWRFQPRVPWLNQPVGLNFTMRPSWPRCWSRAAVTGSEERLKRRSGAKNVRRSSVAEIRYAPKVRYTQRRQSRREQYGSGRAFRTGLGTAS